MILIGIVGLGIMVGMPKLMENSKELNAQDVVFANSL